MSLSCRFQRPCGVGRGKGPRTVWSNKAARANPLPVQSLSTGGMFHPESHCTTIPMHRCRFRLKKSKPTARVINHVMSLKSISSMQAQSKVPQQHRSNSTTQICHTRSSMTIGRNRLSAESWLGGDNRSGRLKRQHDRSTAEYMDAATLQFLFIIDA